MTIRYWFTDRWGQHLLCHEDDAREWFVVFGNQDTLATVRTLSTQARRQVVMHYWGQGGPA